MFILKKQQQQINMIVVKTNANKYLKKNILLRPMVVSHSGKISIKI